MTPGSYAGQHFTELNNFNWVISRIQASRFFVNDLKAADRANLLCFLRKSYRALL